MFSRIKTSNIRNFSDTIKRYVTASPKYSPETYAIVVRNGSPYNTFEPDKEGYYKKGLNVDNSERGYGFDFTNIGNVCYYPYEFKHDNSLWIVEPQGKFENIQGKPWYRSNKIILSEEYPFYSVDTIKTLDLTVNSKYIAHACGLGKFDILELWKASKTPISNIDLVLEFASGCGRVDVLNWLDKSGFELNPTMNVIGSTISYGHVDVLKWWIEKVGMTRLEKYVLDSYLMQIAVDKASTNGHVEMLDYLKKIGLLKHGDYTKDAIDQASGKGHTNVLEWWHNSGLALKYSENAIDIASWNGRTNVLNWWVKSNLPLYYSNQAIDTGSRRGHRNVLEWWKNSGLPLKYSINSLDFASHDGRTEILDWWFNSGLKLKYSDQAMLYASINGHIDVLNWWKNSGLSLKYDPHKIINYNAIYDNPHVKISTTTLTWWRQSGLLQQVL
uniref:Ankyrin repeat protein n=1 Tax=viral metagenome TaxID=1070528 RepID=A0A6C0E6H9_9ZZZZ